MPGSQIRRTTVIVLGGRPVCDNCHLQINCAGILARWLGSDKGNLSVKRKGQGVKCEWIALVVAYNYQGGLSRFDNSQNVKMSVTFLGMKPLKRSHSS